MLSRLRTAYFTWAQAYYDRLPPAQREEARRFDEALYSPRGLGAVSALALGGALLAGAIAVAAGKPFWGLLWAVELFVFSVAFVLLVAWFGFWKVKGRYVRFLLLFAASMLLGGLTGYLGARLSAGPLTGAHVLEALERTLPITGAVALVIGSVLLLVLVLRSREHAARTRALELEAERERSARLASEAHLRALQAQIEPHFLFNTLSSAQYLAAAGDPRAADLLARLNQFLRGTLEATRRPSVTLRDELELARHYLAIAQLRLGSRLTVAVEVTDDALTVELPPVALLTLVENAIEHGIEPAVSGGTVEIVARAERHRCVIEVRNSGRPLAAPTSGGTGLANLRQRLALQCGAGADLALFARDDGVTVARLLIPTPKDIDERPQAADR